jgi:trehalose/maltose hydrolase-like predicted phosphorylase
MWYTCVRRDQDTFQAPPLMVFYPSIAHNLLRNRLFQLPAYKANAQAFGLQGAYVPWEVGFTGGFARDNMINHREVHVASDVALFIKQCLHALCNGHRFCNTALM